MASVVHSFVSAKVEGGDPTLVGPNEWNAAHTYTAGGAAGDILYSPDGTAITGLASASLSHYGGRLTLTSATPVMQTDAVNQTSIYYAPYLSGYAPVFDGAAILPRLFLGSSTDNVGQTLNLAGSANWASGSVYDLFLAVVSGVLYFGTGPAWSSTTSRGTGGGTTELEFFYGLLTNKNTMTLRTAAAATQSVPVHQATYLGSAYMTGNGATGMQFDPTPGNGGTNPFVALWNAFNRVLLRSRCVDSTGTWTVNTSGWTNLNSSAANRVNWLDGLQWSPVDAELNVLMQAGASQTVYTQMVLDAVNTSQGDSVIESLFTGAQWYSGQRPIAPQLGLHYIQAVEFSTGGVSTIYGSATNNGLILRYWG